MRITIVIGGLGGGGAERVCVNLANAWAAAGHEPTILTVTQRRPGSVYPLDARVGRVDLGWPCERGDDTGPVLRVLQDAGCLELGSEAPLMAALRAVIPQTSPDVVVSHMDLTNMRVLVALADRGIPVVACEHTDPDRVYLGAWQRPREVLYRLHAAAVVAPHASVSEWFTRRGIRAHRIPNPLLPPGSRAPRSDGRRRLITLGRLSPEKRIGMIAKAFSRIAGDFPEWDLEIYGDGPQREEMARWAGDRVHLHGFTDDPYGALSAADVYVSASCVEGFGNAVWEAMACGLPVVAMECGAPMRTLVRDGIDGVIVNGGEEALAAALAEVMRDHGLRQAMASRASEAVARFPLEAALDKWDRVLTGVMDEVRA